VVWSDRYLDIREQLQIADLLRLGCSLRRIADRDARQQRARPRARKLFSYLSKLQTR